MTRRWKLHRLNYIIINYNPDHGAPPFRLRVPILAADGGLWGWMVAPYIIIEMLIGAN